MEEIAYYDRLKRVVVFIGLFFAGISLIQSSSDIQIIPVEWALAAINTPENVLGIFLVFLFGTLAIGFLNGTAFGALADIFRGSIFGRFLDGIMNTPNVLLFDLAFWLSLVSLVLRDPFYEPHITLDNPWEASILNLFIFWFILLKLKVNVRDLEKHKAKDERIRVVHLTERLGLIAVALVVTILFPYFFYLIGHSTLGQLTVNESSLQELSIIIAGIFFFTSPLFMLVFLSLIMDRRFRLA